MEYAVEGKGVAKKYGDLVAVDRIDFAVYQGECFGLLGPNGAGKSSTMKMLCCLSPLSSGELTVKGMSVLKDSRNVKAILGVVPQEEDLDTDMSVLQNLMIHARYYDIPKKVAVERSEQSLYFFELYDKRNSRIDELSGGMKKRLLIARALLNEPYILVLDEPTTGLDPQARHMMWDRIQRLKAQGTTIILSTHYMEEARRLCDRLVIMDHGRILVIGSPDELVYQMVGTHVLEVTVDSDVLESIGKDLTATGFRVQISMGILYAFLKDSKIPEPVRALESCHILIREANLEDVFLSLTGRDLGE